MLPLSCPKKRRQALRGRNLPRDIRAEVRQGVSGSRAIYILGSHFFALGHRVMPLKIPGFGAEPQVNS